MNKEELAEIRSRINPQYELTTGTESYERKMLVDEIERLRAALEQIAKISIKYDGSDKLAIAQIIAKSALQNKGDN